VTEARLLLERSALGDVARIGRGGQGTVFTAPRVRLNLVGEAVFKEYHAEVRAQLDVGVLADMVAFLESLGFEEGSALVGWTAWPLRLVADRGAIIGFVMPRIPREFGLAIRKSSGAIEEVRGEFQHLLNADGFLANRGIRIHDRLRYGLLADLARALEFLHGKGIVAGDLSPKNVLFSLSPHPRTFFIDCDSMRLRGRSALAQVETPGWDVRAVSSEELATPATDRYKLALLALRLFAQDQDTRDAARLPTRVPKEVRRVVQAGLSADPAPRPTPADWLPVLEQAMAGASAELPVAPPPRPAAAPVVVVPAGAGGSVRGAGRAAAAAGSAAGGRGTLGPSPAGAGRTGRPHLLMAAVFGLAFLLVLGSAQLWRWRDGGLAGGTEPLESVDPIVEATPPSRASPAAAAPARAAPAPFPFSTVGELADTLSALGRAAELAAQGSGGDAYERAAGFHREALRLLDEFERRHGRDIRLEPIRTTTRERLDAVILACQTEMRTAPAIALRPTACPEP
jgi:hypothetical protein